MSKETMVAFHGPVNVGDTVAGMSGHWDGCIGQVLWNDSYGNILVDFGSPKPALMELKDLHVFKG